MYDFQILVQSFDCKVHFEGNAESVTRISTPVKSNHFVELFLDSIQQAQTFGSGGGEY